MQFQHMTSTNPFDPTGHCFSQTIPVQQEKQDETIVKKEKKEKWKSNCSVLSFIFSRKFPGLKCYQSEEIAATKDTFFPLYQQQYKTMSVELTVQALVLIVLL